MGTGESGLGDWGIGIRGSGLGTRESENRQPIADS